MAFKKAPDQAHEDTDKEIAKLEKEITKVYKQASREVEKKIKEFTANFEREDKKWQKQIKKGEASQSDYDAWKRMQVFKGQRFETIRNNTLDILTNANQKAMDIVNGKTKDVFANNANFTAYQMEHQTGAGFGFGIYDSSTVERLIEKKPDLLPQPKVDIPKDKQWNMRSFNNAITQSIIQGESIPDVARRLAIKLGEKNANAMSMHARTAITSAQNAGRQQRYEEAQAMGIELKKQWMAVRDGRTRDLHAMLDGQEVPVDEKFKVQGYEIEYPGDPTAAPEMVYNCRCTMKSEIEKYPSRYRPLTDQDRRELTEKSYKEWLGIRPPANLEYELPEAISMRFQAYEQTRDRIFNQANQPGQSQPAEAPAMVGNLGVVQGRDLTATYQYREDEYDFMIEDIINQQGFDGLPRVVSAKEFDKAVQESGFIAQRTYSAPDQETLDAYRDQLYNGKWYVDCSTGGAQYGQGMYCAASYGANDVLDYIDAGIIPEGIQKEMEHYQNINRSRGNQFAYTETITLDPSAKIISRHDLLEEYNKERQDTINDYKTRLATMRSEGLMKTDEYIALKEQYQEYQYNKLDTGAYAAMKGYDAINAEGHGESGSYTVILNRTKVIIKEDKE